MAGRRALLIAVILLTANGASAAAPSSQCRKIADGLYAVDASFEVPAASSAVWSVLTDYDHLGSFISSLRSSRIQERFTDGALIQQQALGQAFFITRSFSVNLIVSEEPERKIIFSDVLRADFDIYEGSWSIAQSSGAVTVSYQLRAAPKSAIPFFIARRAFRKSAAKLLDEVREEILRRDRLQQSAVAGGSDKAVDLLR